MPILRREFIAGAAGVAMAAGCASTPRDIYLTDLLEKKAGGRLGMFVLDTDTGRALTHRGKEPFGMCSTFKLPLAGVILREADAGRLRLDERIAYGQADMAPYAPVTSRHLAEGAMTIEALAEATQKTSDNVAANLLMRRLGGPEAFTAKAHEIYPLGFRIDRYEPHMNFVPRGELRDTATPEGMGMMIANLLDADPQSTRGLKPASREKLIQWMVDTTTGMKRIRANLPPEWRAGDKTGTADAAGMPNKVNDVAAIWPTPNAPPVIVVAFYEAPGEFEGTRDQDQAVLAEVGTLAAIWIRRQRGL